MNSDILKPIFDKAVAAYPGQNVRVSLTIEKYADGSDRESRYDASIQVGRRFAFQTNLDDAFSEITTQFTPEAAARSKAAEELREKADRIEAGTEEV